MSFVLRAARRDDFAALYRMAKATGGGFTNLPADRATLKARESRIAELESQVEDYRRQLALVITRAVAKNRALVERKPRTVARPKPRAAPKRRASPKPSRPKPKSKRRSKR